MLKRKQTRKLYLEATTIKQLTVLNLGQVGGGISATCSEEERCGVYTRSCSVNTPGCP